MSTPAIKSETSEVPMLPQPVPEPDRRAVEYAQDADFSAAANVLAGQREQILGRWLEAVSKQSFHHGRHKPAVADHIPHLFDAVVDLLRLTSPRSVDPHAPLDDLAVLVAARGHARSRTEQGLRPTDVVVEFRVLRQEIGRAIRTMVPDEISTGDIVAAELLINDALDGAISQTLADLGDYLEQLREELLATTVHDIRQPLTLISAQVQMLDRYLRGPAVDIERARSANEHMREATSRMVALLDTLSDVSRVALGNLDLSLQPVELPAIVHKVVSQLESSTLADGSVECQANDRIKVSLASEPELSGRWDVVRLEQVIANLLSNAIKYSPAGSPIYVVLEGSANSVQMSVKDQGIGVPAEELPLLFGRYIRASNARNEGIEGMGLGLYLTRGIVQAHGGRIWAESDGANQGTTITAILPRWPKEASAA